MNSQSFLSKNLMFLLLFFLLFLGLFKIFQQPVLYNVTLGLISKNYVRTGGDVKQEKTPFIKLTDETALRWDAVHYNEIRANGYKNAAANGHLYLFAFFPLFPKVWALTGLSPVGIVFFNFFLFALGFFLLYKLFQSHAQGYVLPVLLLSLPFMVIFFIPYTEALFYLLFICAAWGFIKKKYWLYCIAMILVAMTRNAFTLVLTAIICTEIIFLFQERKIFNSLKRLLLMSLPLIIGTSAVVVIQLWQGSDSTWNFLSAQSNWGHHLRFPNLLKISDWSHESFGMNIPTVIMVTVPALIYVIMLCLKYCGVKIKSSFWVISVEKREDYLWVMSLFSCLAASCMVLLFQGGNLHGLSRFVLASPYFAIALYLGFRYLKVIPLKQRVIGWVSCTILTIIAMSIIPYGNLSFSYLGMLILSTGMGLYIMQESAHKSAYKAFLCANLFLNVIWSTYLFNMYLSDGWIFA